MPEYTPPRFPVGLRPGSARPSARGLQAALKAAGYMSKNIRPADNYGPNTEAGVRNFHAHNPEFGAANDPEIGPKGWAELHRQAYGGADQPDGAGPAPDCCDPVYGEPPADYRHVTYGGHTVNVRTRVLLERARVALGLSNEIALTQGSYNPGGVAASAGTHDGGGVVDIDVSPFTLGTNAVVRELRRAGFAAWLRTPAEGFEYHIHAVAIGDRELAPLAQTQVGAYASGRNGLANNRPDSAPASVGRPIPQWARKYL